MFQSTPPRGGRRCLGQPRTFGPQRFNPRPRAGGDWGRLVLEALGYHPFQSTPPRGGRPGSPRAGRGRAWCFNPRPRAGGDAPRPGRLWGAWAFQSTPPRGGRRADGQTLHHGHACFNPRPRAGGDLNRCRHRVLPRDVSIHAPARGATPLPDSGPSLSRSFNPRPRAGGDTV